LKEQTPIERFVQSRVFEWGTCFLVLLNTVTIGVDVQVRASRALAIAEMHDDDTATYIASHPAYIVVEFVLTTLFTSELIARWYVEWFWAFFLTKERWWNVLDIFVVTSSIVDVFMDVVVRRAMQVPGDHVVGNASVLRILRVVRVVRIVRIARVMRFFKELRVMVYSILGSLKALLWAMVVFGMTFYIFGITFTVATFTYLDTAEKWNARANADLKRYFGTLDRSVLSLYMSMAGGEDWGLFYDAIKELQAPHYTALFLLFITFAIFAVVNIVTGIFVESAMESNVVDREMVVQEELATKANYLREMQDIFEEMDTNGSGKITLSEFEGKLNDERVIAYFNFLKLDVSDARTLFNLLDYDKSEEVGVDEFLNGCYQLQGESRALDIKLMQCEVRYLRECFGTLSDLTRQVHDRLNDGAAATSKKERSGSGPRKAAGSK
jgi:hypothetical protein